MNKATPDQLRKHNRQLVLGAIVGGLANSRASVAALTGLAKPTVSDLIGELIAEGFLTEVGRGQAGESGGKRPSLLEFVPTARQVIGVSLKADKILGLLTYLDGASVAEHERDWDSGAAGGFENALTDVINALVAQCDVPLLCLSLGVSEEVALETSEAVLAERLQTRYRIPTYVDNSSQRVAMAQLARLNNGNGNGEGASPRGGSHIALLIGRRVEIGIVLDGGLYSRGGSLSSLHLDAPLETTLGWLAVKERALKSGVQYPDGHLAGEELTYLHLRYAALNHDPAALHLLEELSDSIARVFAWIVALLQPDTISLAGSITNWGAMLLERAQARTEDYIAVERLESVRFMLAEAANLVAAGAVADAVRQELGILS